LVQGPLAVIPRTIVCEDKGSASVWGAKGV